MKKYEKPEVLMVEGLSEKVYMAGSGAVETTSNCWSVGGYGVQDWNGQYHVYEVEAYHLQEGVQHISTAVDYTFTFDRPITEFTSDYGGYCSGNTAYVRRESHANAYNSGDLVKFKIFASTGDQATSQSMPFPAVSWSCTHERNVQGILD